MHHSKPKRVVVTGASSGIGAATAEAFAARGATLVLASRNNEALETVARRCRALGGEALVVPTDVTDAEAVQRLADRAAEFLGEIDLWFSNVGVGVVGKFEDVPIASHRRVIEANLIGHLNDAHAVLPIFLRQKRGTFVNMISIGGYTAAAQAVAYSASKFGLRGMSQALRGELSLHPHIHVCDVYPIFVDTPAIRHAGNYAGGRTSVPPGVLNPRTVAKAVVRLADFPKHSTAVGVPTAFLKLAQFVTPNLQAAVINGFLGTYFAKTDPAPPTDGNLFAPPPTDGEIDGGFRRPDQRRQVGTIAAVAGLAGIAVLGAMLGRQRNGRRSPRRMRSPFDR